MKKLKSVWQSLWGDSDRRVRIGQLLGLAFVTGGFVAIGKAWDGAASVNFAQGQLPYLLSGGFMGLGLIVTGCTLLLLSTVRRERSTMTDQYEEMTRLLGRNLSRLQFQGGGNASNGKVQQVVAGGSVYHLPGCKVLDGKDSLMTITVEQAAAEGLEPCRVCEPPAAPAEETAEQTSSN